MAHRIFIAALACALFTTNVSAQTVEPWTGPDPSRRGYLIGHALDNFETAITEICFPFVIQNADANTWTRQPRANIVWRPDTGVFHDLTTYQVGGSSASSVGVGDRGIGRECTVEPDNRIETEESLTVLRGLIARMPGHMAPSAAAFDPGVFERRLVWCAAADATQLTVIASIAAANRRRGATAMFVTIVQNPARDARCDASAN